MASLFEQPPSYTLPLNEHTSWVGYIDNAIPPALTVPSGAVVRTATRPVAGGRLHPGITLEEALRHREFFTSQGFSSHTLTGPVAVEGAEPGDTLEVRILKLVPEEYCYTFHPPGGGCLGAEGFEPLLTVCKIDRNAGTIAFAPGVTLPLQPMLGIVGVAPERDGTINAGPPDSYGGNIDWPGLGEGVKIFLPVFKRGALLYVGDAHARQACGEVSGNSMEVGMETVEFQVVLRKDLGLAQPRAENDTHWITFGFHPDLAEAARIALLDAVAWISARFGLSRSQAYHLCSSAVDLSITQNVSKNKGVHASIPKAVFG